MVSALVLLAAGCGGSQPGDPDGGSDGGTEAPPSIQTLSLADGENGRPYSQRISATGGTPPLTWSLVRVPDVLRWLRVEASTGELGGTPTGVVLPGQVIDLKVTDAEGRSDTRQFTLAVVSCQEGAVKDCTFASGTACLLGTQRCEDGRFTACSGGAPSSLVDTCGASCGACGEAANACADGRCKCGDAEPCADAAAPTCCGGSGAGSCVDTQKELEHCGACGNSCLDANGDGITDFPAGTAPSCVGGVCDYACKSGFARCPADAAFCIDITGDPTNCGGCGNRCPGSSNPPPNASVPGEACQGGVCQVTCNVGYANCNTDRIGDGCETHIYGDPLNCGGCGTVCPQKPNVITTGYACVGTGQCAVAPAGCAPGFADVNGDFADGCEVNLLTNNAHCGSVGNVCGAVPNGTTTCVNGTCTVSCNARNGNCDGNAANGCETDLSSSNNHCGTCSNSCSSDQSCRTGQCCVQECVEGRKPPCMWECF